MIYDHTIIMAVSLDQLETAKRISRALDPDVGGYEAFSQRVTKDSVEYAIYSSPCGAEFATNAAMLLALPDELHASVAADYVTRWTALEPPTLEQVTAFCDDVLCYVDAAPEGYAPVVPLF